jgi:cell division protein FtsL
MMLEKYIPEADQEKLRKQSHNTAMLYGGAVFIFLFVLIFSAQRVQWANEQADELAAKTVELESKRDALQDEIEELEAQHRTMLHLYATIQKNIDTYKVSGLHRAWSPIEAVVIPKADALKTEDGAYDFSAWLDVPTLRAAEIKKVDWIFDHKSFGGRMVKSSEDATTGFKTSYHGWGALNKVGIVLHTKDGEKEIFFDMLHAINGNNVKQDAKVEK